MDAYLLSLYQFILSYQKYDRIVFMKHSLNPLSTHRAFTMLELIFVIVVVGILSFMAASSFQRNTVQEATDQLLSHIRYTQHLAMMDDKFNAGNANLKSTATSSKSCMCCSKLNPSDFANINFSI